MKMQQMCVLERDRERERKRESANLHEPSDLCANVIKKPNVGSSNPINSNALDSNPGAHALESDALLLSHQNREDKL